ncbi:unnamed protein product [Mesocestoides corti]|uniref:G_PROTEIN_RECEP_F1_2 domain-containing protein n=1 Tax=Mesocestoides corti TaxID=53468 RepID=A0A0R3U674_MESCO|nr:unnamed protein product [Mesocestoides corti]
MPLSETSFAILIGCLGVATNAGILIFSRLLGKVSSQKKLSLGGYSTDETYSDHRYQRNNSLDSSAQRRVSETAAGFTNPKKSSMLVPNNNVSLLRLSSLLSINRLEQESASCQRDRCSKSSSKMIWRSQSRRHRVYLQGLLILASSNLLTAFLLMISSLYSIYWTTVDTVGTIATAALFDVFQAIEVGAILWIAVNRALAIHSTSRHNSNRKMSEPARPLSNAIHLTTEKQTSSCWACFCCFCYCSRRVRNVVTSVDLESAPSSTQPASKCLFQMRFQKVSRLCLCSLPLLIMLLAFCGSIWSWLSVCRRQTDVHTEDTDPELHYYTDSINVGVFTGLFLMPTSFLLSTNCLIYRKVAKRHKRFLLRQTSNSSKTTFLIDEETASSPSIAKGEFARPSYHTHSSIPTFTVTWSSDQELNRSPEERCNQLWDVPETSHEHLPTKSSPSTPRGSEPVVCSAMQVPAPTYLSFLTAQPTAEVFTRTSSSVDCSLNPCAVEKPKRKLTCPELPPIQRRRKSLTELYQPVFSVQSRPDHAAESVFVRQLQRQHKRTVVVLASILIVFVVCHAPRAMWICARWFFADAGGQLLPIVTLWSRVCTFVDPVLYGFWGNRAYRRCLRNLSTHLMPLCGDCASNRTGI